MKLISQMLKILIASLLILQATEDILHWGPSSDDRNRAEHLREIQEMFRQFKKMNDGLEEARQGMLTA
ncbi:hypothetical protein NC651_019167 [Populus alba x Populus x berolinensis]|nr:hypothetical protein NC651_019167 [Populus alba x Populus x berolinensis]